MWRNHVIFGQNEIAYLSHISHSEAQQQAVAINLFYQVRRLPRHWAEEDFLCYHTSTHFNEPLEFSKSVVGIIHRCDVLQTSIHWEIHQGIMYNRVSRAYLKTSPRWSTCGRHEDKSLVSCTSYRNYRRRAEPYGWKYRISYKRICWIRNFGPRVGYHWSESWWETWRLCSWCYGIRKKYRKNAMIKWADGRCQEQVFGKFHFLYSEVWLPDVGLQVGVWVGVTDGT